MLELAPQGHRALRTGEGRGGCPGRALGLGGGCGIQTLLCPGTAREVTTIVCFSSPSSAIYASRLYLNQYSKSHPERLAQNKPGGPVIRGTPLTPAAGLGAAPCGDGASLGGGGICGQDLPCSEVLLQAASPDAAALCCRECVHPPDGLHRQHCGGEHGQGDPAAGPRSGVLRVLLSLTLLPRVLTAGPQCLHWGGGDGGSWCARARVHRPARCLTPCKQGLPEGVGVSPCPLQ